jgi:hypothetical protein
MRIFSTPTRPARKGLDQVWDDYCGLVVITHRRTRISSDPIDPIHQGCGRHCSGCSCPNPTQAPITPFAAFVTAVTR